MLNESLGKQKIVVTTIDESEVPAASGYANLVWTPTRLRCHAANL